MTISFTVPGVPVPKARARTVFQGGHVHSYTPKKTVEYERLVASHARKAMNTGGISLLLFKGPVDVHIHLALPRPKNHYKKGKLREGMPFYSVTRPDIDNYSKCVLDALNGIVWVDDNQVVNLNVVKSYREVNELVPYTRIWVSEIKHNYAFGSL